MNIVFTNLEFVAANKVANRRKTLSLNTDTNYYTALKSVLKIKRAENVKFIRVGRKSDGGYVMADDFGKGNVAYSFGISNEISWDADMAKRGYEIFMYDMTIDGLPYTHEKFHFFKEGIGGKKDSAKSLDTLENFIKRNGHENNFDMILKMDVEGAEWDFLENVSSETLNRFDQIVFEFHDLIAPKTAAEIGRTINLIAKINATHTLIHLHGNNCGNYIQLENVGVIPETLELTYLRNKNHLFRDDEEIFLPIYLDTPNNLSLNDIPIGYWNKLKI